jgi:hypothetical protein
MGEIRGREKPEEVVVVRGHIDSWDVGQGAHDDGSGIVGAWKPSISSGDSGWSRAYHSRRLLGE